MNKENIGQLYGVTLLLTHDLLAERAKDIFKFQNCSHPSSTQDVCPMSVALAPMTLL